MKRSYKAFLLTAATCTGVLRLPLPHACSFFVVVRHAQQQRRRRPCLLLSAQSKSPFGVENWRNHPDLNIRLDFDTWIVPSRHVQTVLKEILPFQFAPDHALLNLRKKIRLVQSYNDTHQLVLVLRSPSHDCNTTLQLHDELQIQEGPALSIQLDPSYFTAHYIFQKVLPICCSPPPTSYEQLGHVVQLNLKKHHLPFRYIIGQVFLETLLPRIETVLLSKGVGRNVVHGPYHDRTYNNLELLAGKNDTNVTVVEDGISIHFDLRKVYWCSKLANERQYLLRQFMLQRDDNVVLVDVFSGVGALCLLAAKQRHCIVHANDWNPHAIASLNDAVQRNHLHTNAIQTTCGDAYEYLVDIGLHWETLPHFVVMNYPLEAPTFLSALRWWRVNTKKTAKQHAVVIPTFYVYTFCHSGTAGSSPTTTSTSTMETAIDLIAHNLLPEGNVPTPNRKKHLNDLKCNVQAREIRQVMGAKAPGKVVVCVSFKATPQLLRHMQGDYI